MAVFAIGLLHESDENAVRILGKALGDEDRFVRIRAIDVLKNIGGENVRDVLLERLARETDSSVMDPLSWALEEYFSGDPKVDNALSKRKIRR